ncbi:bleomycin resistance protein [Dongia sp.]|uniref:bleomycin resistance protein n=1 Tax=Dongia sp. TaxID=1977262 RepID=UPI0035AF2AC6
MKPQEIDFNALVPELLCRDFAASRAFYVDLLGFKCLYDRPEHGFAYLERGRAQIMIEQIDDQASWQTGVMEAPFGRGINLQIEVSDLADMVVRLRAASVDLYREPYDAWYRVDEYETGQRQFLVQDPDGYLLRFCQHLGERPIQ